MARTALLHLVRSRTSYLKSTIIQSGYHLGRGAPNAKIYTNFPKQFATVEKRWLSQSALAENDKKISIGPQKGAFCVV